MQIAGKCIDIKVAPLSNGMTRAERRWRRRIGKFGDDERMVRKYWLTNQQHVDEYSWVCEVEIKNMPVTVRWLFHVLCVALCLQHVVELDRCRVSGDVDVDVEDADHDDRRRKRCHALEQPR